MQCTFLNRKVGVMLERAFEEAAVYGVVGVDDPEYSVAEALVRAFRSAGLDDLADYWHGNFVVFGLL